MVGGSVSSWGNEFRGCRSGDRGLRGKVDGGGALSTMLITILFSWENTGRKIC